MSSNAERLCLERLQREALECLDTFPSKVVELNVIIEEYMPESAKSNSNKANVIHPRTRSPSTLSSLGNYKPNSPDFDVTTYYSLSTCDRNRTRHGICKRRCHRIHGGNRTTIRRYPGALGQLVAFLFGRLALYTKKIILTPSYFVIDNIVPMLFQKPELKNVQCGPSTNWNTNLPVHRTTGVKADSTIVGNFINTMRPAAVQLIADTTMLKRWLQALAVIKTSLESIELTNASRTTETIDCWAYELFFHLKYLQANRTRRPPEKVTEPKEPKDCDDVTHLNLWHRMVQLRNNYIILYETLNNNQKILDLASTEVS
ncbi:hypothetical protein KPH14_009311 [Odynerus spinipes]|uniref:Uncharacterized protein n=1 Tax=Odynerus spinipes TaxID=1348599 RepID=A0AAD9VQT4_9HYME|nr:hypothetical protein KPH14_009311 [Odynerus spinipes]